MDFFWEKDDWQQHDPHLKSLTLVPFRRNVSHLPEKEGLYFVRGPRQIGKSSWMKMVLSHFTSRGLAKDCFYLSCENIRDHLELADVLKNVRGRRVVLLDEISFVEEWARAVKHEVDSGHTRILVLTGSHAADLRRGMDLMPGRWGSGGEFKLLPMSFDECLEMRAQAGWSIGETPEERLRLIQGYFRVGGFPTAVAEGGPNCLPPIRAQDTYLRWLKGDMIRLGKQETYLREMLGQLALTATTPLSLQALARKTQMGSHHTALSYVEALEDCFALRTLYALDADTGAIRFRKDKKFYFTDPLIYWIALDWAGLTSDRARAEEQIAETVAHEALVRRYKRVGYLHTPKGEIDFIQTGNWALEVKWAPITQNLSKIYKDLKIPHKQVWNQQSFLRNWPMGPNT